MELVFTVVAALIPLVGIVAFDWDTSTFLPYFAMESLLVGVATWFKMQESIGSTALYAPDPAERARGKAGRRWRTEQWIFAAVYGSYTAGLLGAVVFKVGAGFLTRWNVWVTMLVGGAWQVVGFIRLRKQAQPRVTLAFQVLGPFRRMFIMLMLLIGLLGDASSRELNVAALVLGLVAGVYFHFHRLRLSPQAAA